MNLQTSRRTIFSLFFLTLVLGIGAIYIGSNLRDRQDVAPEDGSASGTCNPECEEGQYCNDQNQCVDTIDNDEDGIGGCCGGNNDCNSWEVCDVGNGACTSGKSCRVNEDQCTNDGGSCTENWQCCGGNCAGGTCQGAGGECTENGETCGGDGDCCSNNCGDDNKCQSSGGTGGTACSRGEDIDPGQSGTQTCADFPQEDRCWTHAGSGCYFESGQCRCGDGSTDGPGGGSVEAVNCGSNPQICNRSNGAVNIVVAECRQNGEFGNECRIGCGTRTVSIPAGQCQSFGVTPPECGRWQVDITYNGTPLCSDFACETGGCDDEDPTPTPTVPPTCGNGSCDSGESCDGNTQCSGGGEFTPGECRASCNYCGDGVVQANEVCDDGNTNNTDNCNNQCQFVDRQICGDGVLDPGEECDSGIPNSCGPGATCSPNSCDCNPVAPGVCGSSCTSDTQCPADNVCSNGRCKLAVCAPGAFPPAGQYNPVCAANGCEVVECGSPCGADRACPTGLACNSSNVCVLSFCANNRCDNQCMLPPTAIFGEEVDMIIFSTLLVALGLVVYKYDIANRTLGGLKYAAGGFMFDSVRINRAKKNKMNKSRDNFEDKFRNE